VVICARGQGNCAKNENNLNILKSLGHKTVSKQNEKAEKEKILMSSDEERVERGDRSGDRGERGSDRGGSHDNSKKFQNYRLVGRNIFDASVQQKFFKPRHGKMHPYPPSYRPNAYFKPYNPAYLPPQMAPPPHFIYKRPLPPGMVDDKSYRDAQKQHFIQNKKLPSYRLVGRNIFDPSMNQQFMKPNAKSNKYYDRFIKQHPLSHLPLAFQKSVSLAEDKALEEKEKHKHKKDKKRNKQRTRRSNDSDGSSTDSGSDTDTDDQAGKIYSDISSGSEIGSSKKKMRRKKDRKKKAKKLRNKVCLYVLSRLVEIAKKLTIVVYIEQDK
jgi:hypothetical protein